MLRPRSGSLLLLAIMLLGSLGLWLGVPLAWFWVAAHVQAASGSFGAAIAVFLVGFSVSVVLVVSLLARLSLKRGELRAARGLEVHGQVALEGVLAVSAAVAVAVFLVWFLVFSGAEPIPLHLGL